MATYRVGFDGKWQASFDDEVDALTWGREVAETDRLVHVVRRGILRSRLIAIYPESRAEEGEWLWKIRGSGSGNAPTQAM